MDTDETPQRFPLRRLLHRALEVSGRQNAPCEVTKARGYGSRIHKLEEQLDSEESVQLPYEKLDALSEGINEWFYDLEARLSGTDIRFGLHDSTALFIEAEPALADAVVSAFLSVRSASDDD